MTEFIGSRISLISKRDIRYVGTLHEISSENSTVALENVISYGTEGRRPDEEIQPNLDNVYEYIVFRGSDVKDLRIEEVPKESKKPEPPKIPDDPAILGSTRKPKSAVSQPSQSSPAPNVQAQAPPPSQPNQQGQHRQGPQQHFPQQPFPGGMPPPGQRFGPGPGQGPFPGHPGHPGHPSHGHPGVPFGAPPGWYPPYGMPPHMQGQFHPNQMPPGPGQFGGPQGFPPGPPPFEQGSEAKPPTVTEPSTSGTPLPTNNEQPPPLPTDTKPDVTATIAAAGDAKGGLTAGKNSRLIPAVPRSPAAKPAAATNGTASQPAPSTGNKTGGLASIEDANRDARAAVAAAMAKLPAAEKKSSENGATNIDAITKGVNEMRTSDGRGRGRGGRGSHRGGRGENRRIEVPKTDFDFETSNAKFNKQDLVKEAIATGSPVGTPTESTHEAADSGAKRGSDAGFSIPVAVSYNKGSSFFDDISSEIKDRAESKEGGQRLGGKEFRNEERQKNLETFGQGSVDNFRYGRGRGRGRGYHRGRGRGGYNQGGRGGSSSRGGQGDSAIIDG